jgi:hypothetical protein
MSEADKMRERGMQEATRAAKERERGRSRRVCMRHSPQCPRCVDLEWNICGRAGEDLTDLTPSQLWLLLVARGKAGAR